MKKGVLLHAAKYKIKAPRKEVCNVQDRLDFVYLKGHMTLSSDNYFLNTICHLRNHEEMLIYDRFTYPTIKEESAVEDFLRNEYILESLNYPYDPPVFEQEAAKWAARIVFNASQLLLSREKGERDMALLLSVYPGPITASAVLSADLCLRCLPDVIGKAKEIDPDDPLIFLLEGILQRWHYSGVGFLPVPEGPGWEEFFDWEPVRDSNCLRQLYIDRVIGRRVGALAKMPVLRPGIMAAMGDHQTFFWKEL